MKKLVMVSVLGIGLESSAYYSDDLAAIVAPVSALTLTSDNPALHFLIR